MDTFSWWAGEESATKIVLSPSKNKLNLEFYMWLGLSMLGLSLKSKI